MTDSICNFVPSRGYGGIRTVHFVYETDFHTLKQPFMYSIYYAFLVTSGKARVRFGEDSFEVERGSLYLFFPAVFYEVEGSEDFRYMYVSFTGEGAGALCERLGLTVKNPVRRGFERAVDFWFSSLLRASSENVGLLSESVLLYTLSFLAGGEAREEQSGETLCKMLTDYIHAHYTEAELSLGKIASVFSYTEKYLSALFKKHMKTGFTSYVTALRLKRAKVLLDAKDAVVSDVAAACGYRDALYFSRLFKAKCGVSPSEYIAGKQG